MAQFDTSPIDPNDPRLARPLVPPPTLPTANGAPTQPQETMPVALPKAKSPQQTQGLAFPQVGVPGRTAAQEKLANTQEMGSGISRIHNPVLKGLATAGDIAEGLFAPRAEQLTPGTEGNHALRLAQAQNAVKGEEAQHYNAESSQLENPGEKPAANEVELFQKDPEAFARYHDAVKKAAATKEPQLIRSEGATGNIIGVIDPELNFHSAADPNLDPQLKAIMDASQEKPQAPRIEKGEDGTIYSVDLDPATGKPTLTTLVEGKGKKPQLSAEERGYMKAAGGNPDDENTWSPQIMQKYANLKRDKTAESNIGTWQLEEQNGKGVLFNSKTGETRPAPEGLAKAGTAEKNEAKSAPMKAALSYGQSYLEGGKFTGPGDEALQEKFFELAKPSTGFRMTAPQMEMLMQSRAAMEGIGARIKHNIDPNAPWFGDVQRKNIVQTMRDIAKANNIDIGEAGGGGGGGHVIEINGKRMQYKGSGDTADIQNYQEIKK